MSHHLDYIADARLDIADVWCFGGQTGTVFVIDVSYLALQGFHPEGVYEFKIDTNSDSREDITLRATFPLGADGRQQVKLEMLTGEAAPNRDAPGELITPANAAFDQALDCSHGIKFFAGERGEPFYNDATLLVKMKGAFTTGTSPLTTPFDPALAINAFGNSNVSSLIVEVPNEVLKLTTDTVGFWGNTVLPTDAGGWRQLQHAAAPLVGFLWNTPDFNASHPAEQKAKYGETIVQQTAAVVRAMDSYRDGPYGKATPEEYGAYVRDTVLPDILQYKIGTPAHYGPRVQNGKGLTESAMESFYELATNRHIEMGLGPEDATGKLLEHFPYLSEPVPIG